MSGRMNYGKRFGSGSLYQHHKQVQGDGAIVMGWNHERAKDTIKSRQASSLRVCKRMGVRQPSLPKISILEREDDVS